MAKGKSGEAVTRADYKLDLVIERLTGKPTESFTNAAMAWGTEQEPFARAAYELEKGIFVKEIAFVDHPTIEWFGASPDGLVNNDGCLEIKNPSNKTHIKYLKDAKPPAKYINQMLGQLSCTQRDFVDFCSYNSKMPSGLDLFIVRYYRDDKAIVEMEAEVKIFLEEVEAELALLKQKIGVK
jgi:putative phage-type endonuclease